MLALDINKPIENKLHFNVGGEYWIANLLALRAGLNLRQVNNKADIGLTVGTGFKITNYQFDYAYIPYGDLDNTHQFSFIVR
ncbi:hypothetical protein AUJ95_00855 [Candidatus Desantisbacteria bacterium CG2_30_40_21]|uniref:Uncharacterized protein n=3 Tax=unclassified Candidatus Desantisiibacteriota TaxID=3106372 RepID=A0A2M8ARM2_9BACT|nr:MAG: hypothetical protein AUJ95_00855 [Candidatus Desantisbacteria bacterium CG2_30_40_21]PIP39748.1 MAG: hypothetical protein COX18_09005 [Candidatus Desantisbacteria bacterium CG23_combo_of_CG06-09_8_20_14_all_40_23]PJB28257.1 MAG: hypothetical protein CO110_10010 [Candidatus Desantisbacteria bacterium CG_4_9_14_3_um_filter_40_11]